MERNTGLRVICRCGNTFPPNAALVAPPRDDQMAYLAGIDLLQMTTPASFPVAA